MNKRFCVIAKSVQQCVPRHWKETEEEAIEHAKKILRNYSSRQDNTQLVVVEARKIVGREDPLTVRDVDEYDFE